MNTNSKTINMQTDFYNYESVTFQPGDSIERNFVFPSEMPTPVSSFGLGWDADPDLKAGQIKMFTGSMKVVFPNGDEADVYHTAGSLQWHSAYNSIPISDLRGCTVKFNLALSAKSKPITIKSQRLGG
jgi:hypothetical protein